MKFIFTSNSDIETKRLAALIVKSLKPGSVVLLSGDLGAGKTTFVGGALNALGYTDHVVSPTFNILKCYFEVTPNIFHIDAYRLEDQNHDIGLEEYIEGNGLAFIEWPAYIPELIPSTHLDVEITRINDNQRKIAVFSNSSFYQDVFNSLEKI